MGAAHAFFAIMLTDLRLRLRQFRIWVLIAICAWLAWQCFPPADAGYMTVSVSGGERGRYSSAWIGLVLALEFSVLLGLVGFYVVRGTLSRDIDTRVWQLLVATPLPRSGYLLAKWAAHMATFALIIGTTLLVGIAAQYVRGEDPALRPWELVKPSLVLSLPALAWTAAAAVWFDLLPWLRRSAGNVLFFVLWIVMISSSLEFRREEALRHDAWASDPNGVVLVARAIDRVREAQTGRPVDTGFLNVGVQVGDEAPVLFDWSAWEQRGGELFGRLLWLLSAVLAVVAAVPVLDRAAQRVQPERATDHAGKRLRWLDRVLAPLDARGSTLLLAAELRMALRARSSGWWLAVAASLLFQVFASDKLQPVALVFALALPLSLVSRAPLRDVEAGTLDLIAAVPATGLRVPSMRAIATWLVVLALVAPTALRALDAPATLLALLAITVSMVSSANALARLTATSRAFELAWLALLYLVLNGAPLFDIGARAPMVSTTHLAIASAALAVLAAFRWRAALR